jgi:YfiH family protein
MHVLQIHNRRYVQFERLRNERGLVQAFSTRPGDVSPRDGGQSGERAARRRQMAVDVGLDPGELCYCVQVHQTGLAIIDGAQPRGRLEGVDAVITALPGVALMVFSADCPLILVFDPVQRVVGLGHASWRCTIASATRRLVEAVRGRFGSQPGDLLAGIGPAAGPCCYEVQADVFAAAAQLPGHAEFFETRGGRLYFDLWRANRAQLLEAGVSPENLETAEICTICRNDWFYSFRREGPGCGHFGLIAGLAGT